MPTTDELCRSYLDLRWHFDPALGTREGITEADHRLGRFDADAVRAHLAAFRSMEGAVEELDVVDAGEEIDRTALLDDIRVASFRLEHERPHVRNPAFWVLHVCEALHALLLRTDDAPSLAEAAEARLTGIEPFLGSAATTIQEPPVVMLDLAGRMCDGLIDLVRESVARFGPLASGIEEAARTAEDAVAAFRVALSSDLRAHTDERAFAIGEDEFNRRMHHEHALAVTAPEAWRYTRRLADDTEAELAALAAEIDPGLPWGAVVEALQEEGPESDDAVAAMVEDLARARSAVERHALATIGPGALEIRPVPTYLAPLVGAGDGVYQLPPMRHGAGAAVLYLHPAATAATRRWLAVTLGYPGQHLHRLAAGTLTPQVRRNVVAPVTLDGWGLYAAEALREVEEDHDPGNRLQDRFAFYRAVLLAELDIGLHTRSWTVPEGEAYLKERVPLSGREIRAAVRRACIEPSRAAAAVLGRRELLRLRDDCRARAREGFTRIEFHDAVLSFGGLPVSLVRWGMGFDT